MNTKKAPNMLNQDPFENLFGGKQNMTSDNIKSVDREARQLKKELEAIKDSLKL
jgi:hypothetical protein